LTNKKILNNNREGVSAAVVSHDPPGTSLREYSSNNMNRNRDGYDEINDREF
jgi:hypothetical protein